MTPQVNSVFTLSPLVYFILILKSPLILSDTCNVTNTPKRSRHPDHFPSPCDKPISGKSRQDVYKITTPREHPYSVMVVCQSYTRHCSGSMITPHWTITARHCFPKGNTKCTDEFVYAGFNSMREVTLNEYPQGSQIQRVDRVVKHETMDVALVRVKNCFVLTATVNIIPIAAGPLPTDTATNCSFTAFGKLLKDSYDPTLDYIRKTQHLQVVWPCDCYYQFWKIKQSKRNAADGRNFVCSLPRQDYGTCEGDSGSGLVCNSALQGVTSVMFWDDEHCVAPRVWCGDAATASVFVEMSLLKGWVDGVKGDPEDNGSRAQEAAMSALVLTALLVYSVRSIFSNQ